MSNPLRLLTTSEVAVALGISVRQVSRLVPETLAPAMKGPGTRGAFMFAEEDVTAERARRIAAAEQAVAALQTPHGAVASPDDGRQAGEAPPDASPVSAAGQVAGGDVQALVDPTPRQIDSHPAPSPTSGANSAAEVAQ